LFPDPVRVTYFTAPSDMPEKVDKKENERIRKERKRITPHLLRLNPAMAITPFPLRTHMGYPTGPPLLI